MSAKIAIEVGDQLAEAYAKATPELRRRAEFLAGVELIRALGLPKRSLEEIMDAMSREAEARGMTPEILQEILNER
jgi:hypothetical protein